MLEEVGGSAEREGYILMDRLHPPLQPSFFLDSQTEQITAADLVCELGVYGLYVRCVHVCASRGVTRSTTMGPVSSTHAIWTPKICSLPTPHCILLLVYFNTARPAKSHTSGSYSHSRTPRYEILTPGQAFSIGCPGL